MGDPSLELLSKDPILQGILWNIAHPCLHQKSSCWTCCNGWTWNEQRTEPDEQKQRCHEQRNHMEREYTKFLYYCLWFFYIFLFSFLLFTYFHTYNFYKLENTIYNIYISSQNTPICSGLRTTKKVNIYFISRTMQKCWCVGYYRMDVE